MLTRRSVLLVPMLAGALAPSSFEALADDYPSGPITFIVSFPPGGSIDVVMRAMAPKLQERLGKPVVIENRAGAGGYIAAAAVAKAPPDGLTLLAAASSLAANPTLFKNLPFDTLKDLQAVALLFRTPLALVVDPSVPAKSVSELIALLKQKPGEITFGTRRCGRGDPSRRRAVPDHDRHQDERRRLSRRAARPQRRDGGSRRADVRRRRQRNRRRSTPVRCARSA